MAGMNASKHASTAHGVLMRASTAAGVLSHELSTKGIAVRQVLAAEGVGLILPAGVMFDLSTNTPGWRGIKGLPVQVIEGD